ncbi:MAG TPA: hypothetical protein VNZ45_00085 [Bacteroidia bacterium]|jgi:hypothetical protein|nr:hypothetical protein [Bacteroidia bacterium]
MADFTGNPLIVLAADVAGLAANSGSGNNPGDVVTINGAFYLVVWKGPTKVYQVEMMGYVADADVATIFRYDNVDVNSPREFAILNGASDLTTQRTGNVGWSNNGLLVKNNGITNGRLNIFHA